MSHYLDTGVLLKGYVLEPDSPAAVKLIDGAGPAVPYSHLHDLEMVNALQLKRFRGEMTSRQLAASLSLIDADRASGHLYRPTYRLDDVFDRAVALAKKYAAKLGTRSLDLLHVAVALEIHSSHFVSLDQRQRRAASAEKLVVLPARLPRRS